MVNAVNQKSALCDEFRRATRYWLSMPIPTTAIGRISPVGSIHPITMSGPSYHWKARSNVGKCTAELSTSTTEPHSRFEEMQLSPCAMGFDAVQALTTILADLGNAEWSIKVRRRRDSQVAGYQRGTGREVDRVVLLSGGLDSASGAATGATPHRVVDGTLAPCW
ncbi:hypothetical protein [Nonomuraea dietziae]|uniref:hypothetical protein n=1 Tax=Nonomuraea dietziae TaxID=65515 RepID=UPI0033ED5A20